MNEQNLKQKLFIQELQRFAQTAAATQQRFTLSQKDLYPCLEDKTSETQFDRHYIYHTAWAARCVSQISPAVHYDFSSSLYFSALVSAFVPVEFYDLRPPALELPQLKVGVANLKSLSFGSNSLPSVSSMHVVEHIGLGRYGDEIDYDGDLKAIRELQRVTAKGGHLLFVVPIGQDRIQFNAHRIYSYSQVVRLFEHFELKDFSLIPDQPAVGHLISGARESLADEQVYGCGCFWWVKKNEDP